MQGPSGAHTGNQDAQPCPTGQPMAEKKPRLIQFGINRGFEAPTLKGATREIALGGKATRVCRGAFAGSDSAFVHLVMSPARAPRRCGRTGTVPGADRTRGLHTGTHVAGFMVFADPGVRVH